MIMNTINFDQLFQTLQTGVESIAKESFQNYYNQAKADGQSARDSMKTNLQNWTAEVGNGALTAEDLEFLLKEEDALDEMIALKQAGLGQVQLDKFKNALISLVVNTLTGLIKV
jgi:hypothetical protein